MPPGPVRNQMHAQRQAAAAGFLRSIARQAREAQGVTRQRHVQRQGEARLFLLHIAEDAKGRALHTRGYTIRNSSGSSGSRGDPGELVARAQQVEAEAMKLHELGKKDEAVALLRRSKELAAKAAEAKAVEEEEEAYVEKRRSLPCTACCGVCCGVCCACCGRVLIHTGVSSPSSSGTWTF